MGDVGLTIPSGDLAKEGIRWYIRASGLRPGDRLPSERSLSQLLGVSRTALRPAISQLISMHVLESRQGVGTFICSPKVTAVFQDTYSFSDAVRDAGMVPASRVLFSGCVKANARLRSRFGEHGEPYVFHLRRIRLANGRPIALESAYVRRSCCPGIEQHDFSSEELYKVFLNVYGIRIEHGDERIFIDRVYNEEAKMLDVDDGQPVYREQALECDGFGFPVEFTESLIVPSRFRFISCGSRDGASPEGIDKPWVFL